MGNGFAETSVNKIDQKKFEENFKKIDWGAGAVVKAEKEPIDIDTLKGMVNQLCIFLEDAERFYGYRFASEYVTECRDKLIKSTFLP